MDDDERDALKGGRERVGLHLTREERRERALRNSPFQTGVGPHGGDRPRSNFSCPPYSNFQV